MPTLVAVIAALLTAVPSSAAPNDHRPVWTPDGGSVIFMSDRAGGDWELFRIGTDGTGLTRLTHHPGWDGYGDVSPDGRWLIFDRRDDTEGARVVKLELATRRETTIATFAGNGGGGRWSPDGRWIVHWIEEDGNRDLYLMNADGSGRRRLTRTPADEHDPMFAPDGRQILMVVNLETGTAIDVMRLDGSGRQRLLTSPGRMYGLAWSPDGSRVAFNADDAGSQHLYVMNPDGSGRRALTSGDLTDHLPVWSPDSRRLIFTREANDRERVMILDVASGRMEEFRTGFAGSQPKPPPPVVFEGVHLVPLDRDGVLEDMTVVVEEGRIAAIGRRGHVRVPPTARRVDARGRYLLPGLVDMHVHLRERAYAGLYLAHGVTTVRDMNGRLGDTLSWRDEVLKGTLDGPRIVAGGVTLYDGAPAGHPYPVGTAAEARRAVRDMAARGYDVIKVYRVRREPFRALMEEARRLSIPVAGHHPDVVHDQSYDAPLDISTDEVLASGMVSIEHLDELIVAALRLTLDPEAIGPLARSIRARNVAVTTLLGQDFMVQQIRREKAAYLNEARTREIRASFGEEALETARQQIRFIETELPRNVVDLGAAIPEFSLLMLRRFHEEGVDLLVGTDSHGALLPAGRSALDEMDLFVTAGLQPYDALRAATVNAARALGRLGRAGTVAVGKDADLLLLDANPLHDLKALRHPRGAMVLGRFYDQAALESLGRLAH